MTINVCNNTRRSSIRIVGTTLINEATGDQSTLDHEPTPKDMFNFVGISFDKGNTSLDGATLSAADMNKPMSAFGLRDGDTASLHNVVKADNAILL